MSAVTHRRLSRESQRRNVLWLSIALCMWFMAIASHLHAADEDAVGHNVSHACSFCFSSSNAAAPPQAFPIIVRVAASHAYDVATYVPPLPTDAPSSYLSRGPPSC